MNFATAIRLDRLDKLQTFLVEMNKRGLAEFNNSTYSPPDEQLAQKVMYFQALALAPSDRRMLAHDIIGVPDAQLSHQDKALNASCSYWFGPTAVLTYLTGITDFSKAHVDFSRAHTDRDYVEHLRENIAFAKRAGHSMWTSTELHTSLQTEARNYCRLKYNDPTRPAGALDLIEWMGSLKAGGWIDRVLEAKTLEDAYNRYIEPRGVGPYFGGNAVMMIANIHGLRYTHDELFCAPGGGAINTVDYLFEGTKVNPLKAINWIVEQQATLLPDLSVPAEFQNMTVSYGPLWAKPQTHFTANSFEVGMCQFSVYRKFHERPELMKKRPNTALDLSKFKQRELEKTGKIKPLLEF